ncbi:MAG: DNA repair exonuclease [Candidatus Thorarchaeota archaeon]|nr:MAG: DNA repair exonuclease [Candidatus Thorarchaeota archaeon]
MTEDSIRFLHISDTHLGVHYALRPRNLLRRAYGELFFRKVEEVINEAISVHNVDFIIHSGDFFNRSKPPPEVIDRGVNPFQLAARKGIPIYIIPGNHERSKLPLGLLPFSEDNINLFAEPCSYLFEKNGITIKITGFPHVRYNVREKSPEILKKAWHSLVGKDTPRHDYSILAIHELLEGSRIESHTFRRGHEVLPLAQIPRRFNCIACGHVHRFQFLYNTGASALRSTNRLRALKQHCEEHNWHFHDDSRSRFPDPVISYAGSLERVSIAEKNEPKGYIIGELEPSDTEHRTLTAKYQFYEIPAVKMIYGIWDLSESSMDDYAAQTLEEIYKIQPTPGSYMKEESLTGIIRIRIKGKGFRDANCLDYLRQEAKRLRFYLTIREDWKSIDR